MEQNWLTIEEKEDGKVLIKCAEEATGEIVIPDGVIEISGGAFKGCDKITSLVIPEGLKYISHRAFNDHLCREFYCPSLVSICFPSNMLTIRGLGSMENVLLWGTGWYNNQPDGVVYAGNNVIGYKGEMPKGAEIVIKEGTKFISHSAFKNCHNLKKIILPKSLVYIDKMVFHNCDRLETIDFSSDVRFLGQNVLDKTLWYKNQPYGVVYAGVNAIGYKGYRGDKSECIEIEIKEGTKYIAAGAFSLMGNLEKVTFPKSVVSIGFDAFSHCEKLTTLCFPEESSVETINHSLLGGDKKFSELLFEGGLQETEWEVVGWLYKRKKLPR